MSEVSDIEQLREEIEQLLATALHRDASHDVEMQRRDELHIAETERRDELHVAELGRRDQLHVDEITLLTTAIQSRDIIGQAKGVIMVTMGCNADEAFRLLKEQSQFENRKIVEIAGEIAERAARRPSAD